MVKCRTRLLAVAAALVLGGCAAQTSELQTLKEQVRLQQKQLVDLKARQEEHQAKLEILDNGFKLLGDKVEDNSRRLEESEGLGGAAPSAPPPAAARQPVVSTPLSSIPPQAPAPPPAVPAPSAAPIEDLGVTRTLNAADLYRSALDSFTQENYRRAVLEFEEFVANHPGHDLADNAQYWIGECYYAQKNFAQAVVEFEKVEKHFSGGNKAAAAILKKGFALHELGRAQEARAALEKVVSSYPATDEASTAEKKLSQWR